VTKQHHIGEVENLFNIPRSRIQFYLKKALLDVDRDKDNGYHLFTRADLLQLKHLLVARTAIDLSLEDSRQRINAANLEDFRRLFFKQEQQLLERIAKDRRSLEVLSIFNSMIARIVEKLGTFSCVEAGPFHLFGERFAFDMQTSVIDVGYVSALFSCGDEQPVFTDLCSVVYDSDSYLISEIDLAERKRQIIAPHFATTVVKADAEMETPELLLPLIAWARGQGHRLQGAAFTSYLFEVTEDDKKYYYHELWLPLLA
jgi:DNA-binding transcriptional MerR regulator